MFASNYFQNCSAAFTDCNALLGFSEPVCAIGQGVAAFCGVQTLEDTNKWALAGYCLTAVSI